MHVQVRMGHLIRQLIRSGIFCNCSLRSLEFSSTLWAEGGLKGIYERTRDNPLEHFEQFNAENPI